MLWSMDYLPLGLHSWLEAAACCTYPALWEYGTLAWENFEIQNQVRFLLNVYHFCNIIKLRNCWVSWGPAVHENPPQIIWNRGNLLLQIIEPIKSLEVGWVSLELNPPLGISGLCLFPVPSQAGSKNNKYQQW